MRRRTLFVLASLVCFLIFVFYLQYLKISSISLRISSSEIATRLAFEIAPIRTAYAKPNCGKALAWETRYTRDQLQAAEEAYQKELLSHGARVPRICIAMPVTSRSSNRTTYDSRKRLDVTQLLLVSRFIKSVIDTTKLNENRFTLEIYIAADEGDPYYDNLPRVRQLQRHVKQLATVKSVPLTLHDPIILPLLYGNNVYFWNHALAQAFLDGCDYLYQASDDNVLHTSDYFAKLLQPFLVSLKYAQNITKFVLHRCVAK